MVVIGSICPVEPGRMRNSWYPRQRAAYMTGSISQGLKAQSLVAERDFTFGMKSKEEQIPKKPVPVKERPVEVQTKLLPVLVFWHPFETYRRLTIESATTGHRNHRDVSAPKSHILQDSHKCPGARKPRPRTTEQIEKSHQFHRCRTRRGVSTFAPTRPASIGPHLWFRVNSRYSGIDKGSVGWDK